MEARSAETLLRLRLDSPALKGDAMELEGVSLEDISRGTENAKNDQMVTDHRRFDSLGADRFRFNACDVSARTAGKSSAKSRKKLRLCR